MVSGTGDMLAADAVCLLDVPVNKTGTSFMKPVDSIAGDAIAALGKVRPQVAKRADWKTGKFVDLVFMVRLTGMGKSYLNHASPRSPQRPVCRSPMFAATSPGIAHVPPLPRSSSMRRSR